MSDDEARDEGRERFRRERHSDAAEGTVANAETAEEVNDNKESGPAKDDRKTDGKDGRSGRDHRDRGRERDRDYHDGRDRDPSRGRDRDRDRRGYHDRGPSYERRDHYDRGYDRGYDRERRNSGGRAGGRRGGRHHDGDRRRPREEGGSPGPDAKRRRGDNWGGREGHKSGGTGNYEDLLLAEGMLSYKHFLFHMPDDISPEDAQEEYRKYKQTFQEQQGVKQSQEFFKRHVDEEWFKEKYHPLYLDKWWKRACEETKSRHDDYVASPSSIEPLDQLEYEENHKNDARSNNDEGAQGGANGSGPRKSTTLLIKSVAPHIGRDALIAVAQEVPGLVRLHLSDAAHQRRFHRMGWVTYDSSDAAGEALEKLNGMSFSDFKLQVVFHTQSRKRPKYAPDAFAESDAVEKDIELAKQLAEKLCQEKGLEFGDGVIGSGETGKACLDRYVDYLRKVHHYCYYCAEEYADEDDVQFKCGSVHLRGKKRTINDPKVAEGLNSKNKSQMESIRTRVKERIEKELKIESKFAHNDTKKVAEQMYETKIMKVDDSKYRCVLCVKLFKGPEFVTKHLNNKHDYESVIARECERVYRDKCYQNYMDDANKASMGAVNHPNLAAAAKNADGERRRSLLGAPLGAGPRNMMMGGSPHGGRVPGMSHGFPVDPRPLTSYGDVTYGSLDEVEDNNNLNKMEFTRAPAYESAMEQLAKVRQQNTARTASDVAMANADADDGELEEGGVKE